MAGTLKGGLKARDTNIKRYGEDYYINMGRKGGCVCGTKKGFAADPNRAREAGRKGGTISRRGKAHDTR